MCSGCGVNVVVDGRLNVAVLSLIPEEDASLVLRESLVEFPGWRCSQAPPALPAKRSSPPTSCTSSRRSQSLTYARQPPGSRPRSAFRAHRPAPG